MKKKATQKKMFDKDLGIKEVAAELGYHPDTISEKIRKGPPEGLDAERKGPRKVTVKLSEVERYREYWRSRTRE